MYYLVCCWHSLVLLGLLSVLPILSPALWGTPRYSQTCCWASPVLRWLPADLLCPCGLFAGAPRCTWWPLHRSSTLWDLITLKFWSNNSQILPEAHSVTDKFCWWNPICQWSLNGINLKIYQCIYCVVVSRDNSDWEALHSIQHIIHLMFADWNWQMAHCMIHSQIVHLQKYDLMRNVNSELQSQVFKLRQPWSASHRTLLAK